MSVETLYPLRFHPILKRALWGGRRLGTFLGKPLGPHADYAECWEISDLDRDQSVVAEGELAGSTLSVLLAQDPQALLGRHHDLAQFPLLAKFIDACRTLSVQVHPNDEQAARIAPGARGKTEAWVVLNADAQSYVYAGLKPGVDRAAFEGALSQGRIEQCLHRLPVQPGDGVLLPAGTVHAIGAGILLAEVGQTSDTTFRLFDWNRRDAQGRPRPLHIRKALEVTDFSRGPMELARPVAQGPPGDRVEQLVQCDHFVVQRRRATVPLVLGGDDRFHVLLALDGIARLEYRRQPYPLANGQTLLLPAAIGSVPCQPAPDVTLLDCWVP